MANSNNITDRPAVLNAIAAGQALTAFGIVVISTLLCCETYALFESRRRLSFKHAKTRAPIWLFAVSLTGLWTAIICVLMWWVNWVGHEQACVSMIVPTAPIAYVAMKQCLYLFLYDRAKVVHDALGLHSLPVRLLRWAVFASCTVGVPIVTWPLFFIYWRGKVLPEGICVEYTVSVGAIISVAALDLLLSVSMLILFIVPVLSHLHRVGKDEIAPVFQRLIRRNLVVSSLLIVSTLTALSMMTIELTEVFGDHPPPELEHVQVWATFFPFLDAIATVVLPHILSNAWLPVKLREAFSKASSHSNNAAHTSSKNVHGRVLPTDGPVVIAVGTGEGGSHAS